MSGSTKGTDHITLMEYAFHLRPALRDQEGVNQGELAELNVPMMGSCNVCGATIAAFNACIGKGGYLIGTCCANSDLVATTMEEATALMGVDEDDEEQA